MNSNPLVSVVIPVYNVEKYLRECVDSVLKQTYKNLEIVLVDDGSKDTSGKICDEYAESDSRIRVIHKQNGGLSSARNEELKASSGEYLYFLDSDDYLTEDAIGVLVNQAEKENSDIVFFEGTSFDDETGSTDIKQGYKRKHGYSASDGYSMFCEFMDNGECYSGVPLQFFKRKFIIDNSLFFAEGLLYEDVLFTYHILLTAKKVSCIKNSLYYRRLRSGSIMTSITNERNYSSILDIFHRVKELAVANGKINEGHSKAFLARYAFSVIRLYCGIKNKTDKINQSYKEFKKEIKADGYYRDGALTAMSKGKSFWILYKLYEKSIGRVFGK